MTYAYNLTDALIEQQYPSGRKVKNTLDAEGDLAQVQSQKNASDIFRIYASSFVYNAAGAVTSLRLGNGKFENTVFNSRLQPTQIGLGSSASTQNVLKLNYDYGTTQNNGNVLGQTITVPTVGSNPGFTATQTYTYDSLNRINDAKEIIGATETWKETFLYDRYGNRTFDTTLNRTTTIPAECPAAVCNPGANTSDNRLKTSDGYDFDNAGNTKLDAELRKFTYDGENKQVKVETTNSGGTVIATNGEYWYDGDGKRIKKKGYTNNVLTEETIFVYDAGGKLVAEYSTEIASASAAKVAYVTNDHLGSPRINTDAVGNVTARHDYHPFGEEITTSQRGSGLGYAADTVRKQFTGYERDSETGLDFAQARYQLPSQGRFITADPYIIQFEMKRGKSAEEQAEMLLEYLAEPRNHNRYIYALNNPLKYTDPLGMRPPNEWEKKALGKLDEWIAAEEKAGNKDLATALTNAKAEISAIIAKLGKKENSVGVGIAVFAILQVGTEEGKKYADNQALDAPGHTYGAGESKCNVFVAMAHINGGGIKSGNYPSVNGKFAVANWLGDWQDRMKLKNLPVHWGSAGVGDVVAWRNTDANQSGHSGVSIGGGAMIYAGGPRDGTPQVRTIAYVNGRMQTESSLFGLISPSHEPGVIRRFNGKP